MSARDPPPCPPAPPGFGYALAALVLWMAVIAGASSPAEAPKRERVARKEVARGEGLADVSCLHGPAGSHRIGAPTAPSL